MRSQTTSELVGTQDEESQGGDGRSSVSMDRRDSVDCNWGLLVSGVVPLLAGQFLGTDGCLAAPAGRHTESPEGIIVPNP